MIRILTDSTSDIRGEEIKKLGIEIVPLNISFGKDTYADGVDISVEEFYEKLQSSKEFPKTSQPAPALFEEIFLKAKENKDELIYLSISSGLSGTIQSARVGKDLAEYDSIYIVDTLESIQGLRLLVLQACQLRDEGKSAQEIVNIINELKQHVHILSAIDTLEFLHKGGRLSRALAIVGETIRLKPLVDLDPEGKIRVYRKTIGLTRAYKAIEQDLLSYPIDLNYPVCFGFSSGIENLNRLMERVIEPNQIKNYDISQIGAAIGSHVGPNGFCMAYICSTKERN